LFLGNYFPPWHQPGLKQADLAAHRFGKESAAIRAVTPQSVPSVFGALSQTGKSRFRLKKRISNFYHALSLTFPFSSHIIDPCREKNLKKSGRWRIFGNSEDRIFHFSQTTLIDRVFPELFRESQRTGAN
jgi:hypothetical protein